MYHVDNSTGVPVMPQPSPVTSETELFFTEGGNGVPPTFPGPDWFNIIQSELINILRAAGLDPDKMDNTQILAALKKLFLSRSNPFGDIKADGAAAIATALSNLGFTQVGRDIIAGGTASDVLAYLGVPNLLNGKQDADNTLTALARLAGAANKLPYFSGPDVMSMTDFSDIGRAIIAASDKPSVLSYLELTTLGQALVKGGTASDILRTLGFNNGNGWYRIGEILIQFGHIPFAATSVPVTFPIPFPVVIDQIIVSDAGYASGNTWGATDRTQLGFTAQTNSTGQGGQYFAIGR
ncbi:gp53-like domain-containing protein [Citrobacter freundii]|uniref:gp53-like domain-containing protein n=1 Tax=Citrobacter freundii TaxID=546 RepID=UPI0020181651|nr:hypothetical protein [Citrobacter freundii]